MSVYRENPGKIYVKVRADHLLNGTVRPLMLRSEDGPVIRIDRVLDVRQAASLKAGGQGVRYVCEAAGKQLLLFSVKERRTLKGAPLAYKEEVRSDCGRKRPPPGRPPE